MPSLNPFESNYYYILSDMDISKVILRLTGVSHRPLGCAGKVLLMLSPLKRTEGVCYFYSLLIYYQSWQLFNLIIIYFWIFSDFIEQIFYWNCSMKSPCKRYLLHLILKIFPVSVVWIIMRWLSQSTFIFNIFFIFFDSLT
jgi:hypothetical protein